MFHHVQGSVGCVRPVQGPHEWECKLLSNGLTWRRTRVTNDLPAAWRQRAQEADQCLQRIKNAPNAIERLGFSTFHLVLWALQITRCFHEEDAFPLHPWSEAAVCLALDVVQELEE